MKNILFYFIILISIVSCKTNDFVEQFEQFENQEWSSKQKLKFNFNIVDSTANYLIYFSFRHQNNYHFKNCWIQFSQFYNDSLILENKYEIPLAKDEDGWLGVGMNDIYYRRILLTPKPVKFKKGINQFKIQQIMREDPLLFVLSSGLKIEKITP